MGKRIEKIKSKVGLIGLDYDKYLYNCEIIEKNKIEIEKFKSAIKKGFEEHFGFSFYHSKKEFDFALSNG